jgi:hypothetical protein
MADLETTVEDLYEGVMTELGDPTPDELKPTVLWQKLLDSINYYASKIGVSSNHFLLAKSKRIQILSGKEDYDLTGQLENYGRGMFAEVISNVTAGKGFTRLTIPVVDATVQSLVSSPSSLSSSIIITRDIDGIVTARIRPLPTTNYGLVLWYRPTRLNISVFDDKPSLLEQFFPNVRKRAALATLPHVDRSAEWKAGISGDDRHGLIKELNDGDMLFEHFLMLGDEVGGEKRPYTSLMNDDGY